ncbi:uncharacterized protein LOC144411758 isoform X2 [Styela clava]
MKPPVRFSLIFGIWCLVFRDSSSSRPQNDECYIKPECQYKGKMCDVNPIDCEFQKLYKEGCLAACKRLSYKQLYKPRQDVRFWVNTTRPSWYAKNLTFTIVSIIKNNWTTIPDCCGVKWNEFCTLPRMAEEEVFMIIIPLIRDTFCYFEIQEFNIETTSHEWCDDVVKVECLYEVSGEIYFLKKHEDASTDRFQLKAERYCFFEAAKSYLAYGRHYEDNEFVTGIKNFTLIETTEEVEWENNSINCTINGKVSDIESLLHNKTTKKGNALCWFLKVSGVWNPTSTCKLLTAISDDETSTTKLIIVIGVVVAVALLIFIIIFFWLYKTKIQKCFPSYKETQREISEKQLFEIEEKQNFLPDNTVIRNRSAGEQADQICFAEICKITRTEAKTARPASDIRNEVDSGFGNDLDYISPTDLQNGVYSFSNRKHNTSFDQSNESTVALNHETGNYMAIHSFKNISSLVDEGETISPSNMGNSNDQYDSGFDNKYDQILSKEPQHKLEVNMNLASTFSNDENLSVHDKGFQIITAPDQNKFAKDIEAFQILTDCEEQYTTKNEFRNRISANRPETEIQKRSITDDFDIGNTASSLPQRSSTSSTDTDCGSEKSNNILFKRKCSSENDIVQYVKMSRADTGFESEDLENEVYDQQDHEIHLIDDGYMSKEMKPYEVTSFRA